MSTPAGTTMRQTPSQTPSQTTSPSQAQATNGFGPGPASGTVDLPLGCHHCGIPRPLQQVRDDAIVITSPRRAASLLGPLLGNRDREACAAALVDTKHRVMGVEMVSIGSLDHTFMAPREIYRLALVHNAAALVVAHNHPSGDATPSPDDIAVTRRLLRAGELIGVDLLDHLVVAGAAWHSLARAGHI